MDPDDVEVEGLLTGKPCPMIKASIFSYFTWQWMQSFITAGNKKRLEVINFISALKLVYTKNSNHP